MVASQGGRPAVVIGFSLGCKIAKYFLHWCRGHKGDDWMARNLQHFVALGGPFRGAVALQRAVLVDGSFPPLDLMFSQSQMLTILRGVDPEKPETIRIGSKVKVEFETDANGDPIPYWRVVED